MAAILTALAPMRICVALDPHDLLGVDVPPKTSMFDLRVRLLPRDATTATIGAKSVRRAQAAVRQYGPDNVVCVVSWRLAGTAMVDPVVTVQLRLPKIAADGDAESMLEAAG